MSRKLLSSSGTLLYVPIMKHLPKILCFACYDTDKMIMDFVVVEAAAAAATFWGTARQTKIDHICAPSQSYQHF